MLVIARSDRKHSPFREPDCPAGPRENHVSPVYSYPLMDMVDMVNKSVDGKCGGAQQMRSDGTILRPAHTMYYTYNRVQVTSLK